MGLMEPVRDFVMLKQPGPTHTDTHSGGGGSQRDPKT